MKFTKPFIIIVLISLLVAATVSSITMFEALAIYIKDSLPEGMDKNTFLGSFWEQIGLTFTFLGLFIAFLAKLLKYDRVAPYVFICTGVIALTFAVLSFVFEMKAANILVDALNADIEDSIHEYVWMAYRSIIFHFVAIVCTHAFLPIAYGIKTAFDRD